MTEQEFSQWGEEFFSRFPSVNEWLMRSSPNLERTLKYWRETLEPFSLEECNQVLEDWLKDGTKAFEAYERDNIPLSIRQTIARNRTQHREREKVAIERHYRELGRNGNSAPVAIVSTLERLELAAGFKRLRPIHQTFLDGDLPRHEYDAIKDRILEEL
jgi:hypothetical protein